MSRKKTGDTLTTDDVLKENIQKKERESKRDDKLTEDLMYGKDAGKRTVRDTIEERDRKGAYLHSFGGGKRVVIEWDLNADAIRDQVFRLTVGDEHVYLSAVEIQKYLRWV